MARALYLLSIFALTAGGCIGALQRESLTPDDVHRLLLPEIQSHQPGTAYELIRTLRPEWLENDGEGPRVYYLSREAAGVDALRTLPLREIRELEYLTPEESRGRLSSEHPRGAIVVYFRDRR